MQTWGLTDPGNIRQQNQDSYAIVPFGRDRVLMIVCDGMGGASPPGSAAIWPSLSTSATAAPTTSPARTCALSRATIPWSPTWSSAES